MRIGTEVGNISTTARVNWRGREKERKDGMKVTERGLKDNITVTIILYLTYRYCISNPDRRERNEKKKKKSIHSRCEERFEIRDWE